MSDLDHPGDTPILSFLVRSLYKCHFSYDQKKGPNPIIKALRLLVHLVKVACQKKATELVVLYIVQKHNHFHQFFFITITAWTWIISWKIAMDS